MNTTLKNLIFAIISTVVTLGLQMLTNVMGINHLNQAMNTVVTVLFAIALYHILVNHFGTKKDSTK